MVGEPEPRTGMAMPGVAALGVRATAQPPPLVAMADMMRVVKHLANGLEVHSLPPAEKSAAVKLPEVPSPVQAGGGLGGGGDGGMGGKGGGGHGGGWAGGL